MSTNGTISRRHALAFGAGALAATRFRAAQAAQAYPMTWTFGDVTVTRVIDMQGPFDAARAFPGFTPSRSVRGARPAPAPTRSRANRTST